MCLCCIPGFYGVSTTHLYGLVHSVKIVASFELEFGTVNAHASAGCAYVRGRPCLSTCNPGVKNI